MGSQFDSINQNYFGLIALLVSLVALFTTVLQVLQQYFSSAEGYRRCAQSVMGRWSLGTHRKFRLLEFRIEVVFETPVLFIAPTTNTRGPIANAPIVYIDGTHESYPGDRLLCLEDLKKADLEPVHTANDERASWLTLLSSLQQQELSAKVWDASIRRETGSPHLVKEPKYQLAVGMQSKIRSWDFIPSSITKPYATSAVCHVVEMMAMLGLYWKVFDQFTWNLRAEGNGFILTSTTVHGLGVMIVFAVTGPSDFKENRVIPCNEIKELTFGSVPNIYDDTGYLEQNPKAQSLDLAFATPDEVENTLEALGCQAATLKRYRKDHKHIFSISFEIIAMLAKVFRLRGSNFRMLPNPTSDHWLKKNRARASWTITRLLEVFHDKVKELIDTEGYPETNRMTTIPEQWLKFKRLGCSDEAKLSIDAREAIHDCLDELTDYLLSQKQANVLSVLVAHITKVVEVLENPTSPLNIIVLAEKEEALLDHYFHVIRPDVIGNLRHDRRPLTKVEKEERNIIWVTLMFRMLCWLLLHDFDKSDVQVVPSDLKGSRMPVYIS